VFNILSDTLTLSNEDTLVIIGPSGKVVYAERANFKIESARAGDAESTGSKASNEVNSTQHSHQIQFEKSVERELKHQVKNHQYERNSVSKK
jgi:hypothetical protein